MRKFKVSILLLVFYLTSTSYQESCMIPPTSVMIPNRLQEFGVNCTRNGTYDTCDGIQKLKTSQNTTLIFSFQNFNLRRIVMTYQLSQMHALPQIFIQYGTSSPKQINLSTSDMMSSDIMGNNLSVSMITLTINLAENYPDFELGSIQFYSCDPVTQSPTIITKPSETMATSHPPTTNSYSPTSQPPNSEHTSTSMKNVLPASSSSNSSLTTVLTAVGATIGILLLVLSTAICILALALVFNKRNKKSVPWSHNQNRPVPETPVPSYQGPPLDQYGGQMSDSCAGPGDICNGSFQLLSTASAPTVPPLPSDSGLISIDEWRRKVELEHLENEADMNPLYAGSMCGSEYGEPPQYETVSEAKKAYKYKEVNMLRLAQLRQTSLAQGRVASVERLDVMESGLTGSKQNIAGELSAQAALYPTTQAQASKDLELDGNSDAEDEGDISNCFYETTAEFQASREEQENITQGSIYELDEDYETNDQQSNGDNSGLTENPAVNDEHVEPNTEDSNLNEVVRNESNSSQSSSPVSSINTSSQSASHPTAVPDADEPDLESNYNKETKILCDRDSQLINANEEIPYDESVYDDPSCLDKMNS